MTTMTTEGHKAHLAALPEPVREAREALPIEASELLDYPRDLSDSAHEHADGAAEVIYYYQAHKLLSECSRPERGAAEEEAEDCGVQPKSYDEFASAIAYFVIRTRYVDAVREALEGYRETIEDLHAEPDTIAYEAASMIALGRDLHAIETILG